MSKELITLKISLSRDEWWEWFILLSANSAALSPKSVIGLEDIRDVISDGDTSYVPMPRTRTVAKQVKVYKRKKKGRPA
jgi:hypothetical protein